MYELKFTGRGGSYREVRLFPHPETPRGYPVQRSVHGNVSFYNFLYKNTCSIVLVHVLSLLWKGCWPVYL